MADGCVRASCAVCELSEQLRVCASCRKTYYCSREHQRQHWRQHKPLCRSSRTPVASPPTPPDPPLTSDSHSDSRAPADSNGGMNSAEEVDAYQDLSQFLAAHLDEQGSGSAGGDVFWQASSIRPEYFTSDPHEPPLDAAAGTVSSSYPAESPLRASRPPAASNSPQHPSGTQPNTPDPRPGKGRGRGKAPSAEQVPGRKEETKLVDYVTKCLKDYGMCVVDNFLGVEKGERVLAEVVSLCEAGCLQDGQISSAELSHPEMHKVRGDKIMWVEKGIPSCAYIGYLIERLDRLMKASNGRLGSREINGRTKAMVACYPGDGTGYMQHVDNPNQDGRCITCIYYLNKDWDVTKHGGLLRIQPSQLPSIAVADIEPKFDRLLFFWSDRRNPHEVQPAYRRRFAITVWYFDAEERRQACKRHEIINAIAQAKKKAATASLSPSSQSTE